MSVRFFDSFRTVCVLVGISLLTLQAAAAEPTPETATETTDSVAAPNLAASQEAIEMRYRRFEGTLQQLSEYLRKTDPARAELLVRAIGKSKEGRIPEQLQLSTTLLKKDQLGDAVEQQELVVVELQSLLELLMSEARKDDLEREKKRIQELIKDVNKLISKESDARAETERGGKQLDLQNQQKQISDATQKLVQKIDSQDAAKKSGKNEKGTDSSKKSGKPNEKDANDAEQNSGDKKAPDSKDEDNPPSEKEEKPGDPDGKPQNPDDKQSPEKQSDGKKPGTEKESKDSDKSTKDGDKKQGDSESKPGDTKKPSESQKGDSQQTKPQKGKPQDGKPQKGKPQESKPQKGKPQEGEQPDQPPQESQKQQDQQSEQDESQEEEEKPKKQPDKTTGRDEIERAKLEMERAIEELKKNNKKKASDNQDKAIAELMKAKEKLEEILRQLREEEQELVLAQMESRFRDMLIRQEAINNGTLAIHAIPVDNRTDRHRNRAVELAREEEAVSLLADKALTLLKEEGSSIAFPEAVEQIRDDMLTIGRRLERVDVGEITQNIEQDTVESLKEIIEALQKELEKLKEKKLQGQQPSKQQQQQQQQQQGLVNKLAEMKMLRSLQYRVNRRTKQLGRLVDGEQAVDMDVVSQLKQLSDRQAKVQKATYDLATGKNQ